MGIPNDAGGPSKMSIQKSKNDTFYRDKSNAHQKTGSRCNGHYSRRSTTKKDYQYHPNQQWKQHQQKNKTDNQKPTDMHISVTETKADDISFKNLQEKQ